jgi:hypothetical protein
MTRPLMPLVRCREQRRHHQRQGDEGSDCHERHEHQPIILRDVEDARNDIGSPMESDWIMQFPRVREQSSRRER